MNRHLAMVAVLSLVVSGCKKEEQAAPSTTLPAATKQEVKPTAVVDAGAAAVDAGTLATGPCDLFEAADLEAVLGAGATATPVGDQQCTLKSAKAEYVVAMRKAGGATEVQTWATAMGKTNAITGVGDEAMAAGDGTAVVVRKGERAIRINAAGVSGGAPMGWKDGNVELARRAAKRL